MTKFGELIDRDVPVLLGFYSSLGQSSKAMNTVLHEVAAILSNKAHIIKIDVEKNKELAAVLQITTIPSFIIYRDGQMVWRHAGIRDAQTLIDYIE